MYDMLSPKYDFTATLEEFRAWLDAAGLEQTDVHHGYNGLEGRAVKPV